MSYYSAEGRHVPLVRRPARHGASTVIAALARWRGLAALARAEAQWIDRRALRLVRWEMAAREAGMDGQRRQGGQFSAGGWRTRIHLRVRKRPRYRSLPRHSRRQGGMVGPQPLPGVCSLSRGRRGAFRWPVLDARV